MYKSGQLDILQERSPFVTLAQLMASDGCSLHCVATVGNTLFDANAKTILELTQENLDWCCSTDKENSKYVGVLRACRFIHENPKPLWRTYGIDFDHKKKRRKNKRHGSIEENSGMSTDDPNLETRKKNNECTGLCVAGIESGWCKFSKQLE